MPVEFGEHVVSKLMLKSRITSWHGLIIPRDFFGLTLPLYIYIYIYLRETEIVSKPFPHLAVLRGLVLVPYMQRLMFLPSWGNMSATAEMFFIYFFCCRSFYLPSMQSSLGGSGVNCGKAVKADWVSPHGPGSLVRLLETSLRTHRARTDTITCRSLEPSICATRLCRINTREF